MRKVKWVVLGAATMILAVARPAGGQEATVIRGQVIDAETADPVPMAFVAPLGSDRGALTDSLGRFAMQLDRMPIYALRITQLGYTDLHIQLTDEDVVDPVSLLIIPNPVELEGLTVLTESLADRRRGSYGAGQILTQAELMNGPDGSSYDLILRTMPFVEPCNFESEALCIMGRGLMANTQEVRVCLDNRTIPSEVMETMLGSVDPRGFYLVEIYNRVGEVRMYTPGYIKRLLANEIDLPPLSFGCGGV